ncbi:MAG: DUF87 domain-containing protein [Alphaproteobacteria bacterium]|nr:DUF87 domain-containing protein [Alphaproteobacteria bacterium]
MTEALGLVIHVTGNRATLKIPAADGGTSLPAEIRVGNMLRIKTPETNLFGLIDEITQDQAANGAEPFWGRVEIDFIGELLDSERDRFKRGVTFYPRLGDQVFPAEPGDFDIVYAPPKGSSFTIGSLHQHDDVAAHIMTNELLSTHFAVLGTTGSGKSCTVAMILRSILDNHPSGHVILLDPHNEYYHAFGNRAEVVNTSNLHLPYWMLDFQELIKVFVSGEGGERDEQINVLRDAILAAKLSQTHEMIVDGHVTVDTPVPFRLGEFKRHLDASMGRLEKAETARPYLKILNRLETLTNDKRFSFMFSSMLVEDVMPDLLARILRIPVTGKPITIVDLSGVPSEIIDVVVSVICRMVFDFAVWGAREQSMPVLLVCEEAHRYAPEKDEEFFGPTKAVLSRIAKEGRKYGVALGLVSQRPSELSVSILSQCNTIFALRMGNEHDLTFVRAILPESAAGMLKVLPALHTQEAIIAGAGVTAPMRVRFSDLAADERPQTHTVPFSHAWQEDSYQRDFVDDIVSRWRNQRH